MGIFYVCFSYSGHVCRDLDTNKPKKEFTTNQTSVTAKYEIIRNIAAGEEKPSTSILP